MTPEPAPTESVSPDAQPLPSELNDWFPILVRPFAGQFYNTNPFDHKYPQYLGTNDGNRDFITYQGINIQPGWDGHRGNDWYMEEGTELRSVADGEVVFVGSEVCNWRNANGDTLILRIRHSVATGDVFDSVYVHVSEFKVAVGDPVAAGQVVALSGSTGCSTGPHLHLDIVRVTGTNNGKPTSIDPFGWEGYDTDPWSIHPDGARSQWLWKPGEAPYTYGFSPD